MIRELYKPSTEFAPFERSLLVRTPSTRELSVHTFPSTTITRTKSTTLTMVTIISTPTACIEEISELITEPKLASVSLSAIALEPTEVAPTRDELPVTIESPPAPTPCVGRICVPKIANFPGASMSRPEVPKRDAPQSSEDDEEDEAEEDARMARLERRIEQLVDNRQPRRAEAAPIRPNKNVMNFVHDVWMRDHYAAAVTAANGDRAVYDAAINRFITQFLCGGRKVPQVSPVADAAAITKSAVQIAAGSELPAAVEDPPRAPASETAGCEETSLSHSVAQSCTMADVENGAVSCEDSVHENEVYKENESCGDFSKQSTTMARRRSSSSTDCSMPTAALTVDSIRAPTPRVGRICVPKIANFPGASMSRAEVPKRDAPQSSEDDQEDEAEEDARMARLERRIEQLVDNRQPRRVETAPIRPNQNVMNFVHDVWMRDHYAAAVTAANGDRAVYDAAINRFITQFLCGARKVPQVSPVADAAAISKSAVPIAAGSELPVAVEDPPRAPASETAGCEETSLSHSVAQSCTMADVENGAVSCEDSVHENEVNEENESCGDFSKQFTMARRRSSSSTDCSMPTAERDFVFYSLGMHDDDVPTSPVALTGECPMDDSFSVPSALLSP